MLAQFLESNLAHVSNKSAFLCGVMKTYRQKSRGSNSISNAAGKWLLSSYFVLFQNSQIKYDPLIIPFILDTVSGVNSSQNGGGVVAKGPDEDKIKEILNRTGYKLDVTTGQRKYGGPPPNWDGDPPSSGCEVSY